MKEHPILFSTAMVQALLAGRKTQTRRIFKDHPRLASDISKVDLKQWMGNHPEYILSFCPYGQPGDLLWVRETWSICPLGIIDYKSEGNPPFDKWRPSIHMPKAAARIWMRVKDVRVERLQEISETDAIAEGIKKWEGDAIKEIEGEAIYENYLPDGYCTVLPKDSFLSLWESINGKESLDTNPWVWVVEFEVINTTGFVMGTKEKEAQT